ncbi:MAG: hypothetical protein KatS3mg052_2276 [Candidatus Roseilinea sp.]|nr:MAG: hypothetical protein KatS3mg052_2276 [Candidatus Roseilinea sp.]
MTRPPTIVSTGPFNADSIASFEQSAPGIRLHPFPNATPAEIPADVYYAYGELPSRAAAPKLRRGQMHRAGVDMAIHAPLFASGEVILTTGAGIHAVNVGEYTPMMMLALAHRLPMACQMMQAGARRDDRAAFMPMERRGATLGLIGYGQIGREVARLARVRRAGDRFAQAHPNRGEQRDDGVTCIRRDRLPMLLTPSDFAVVAAPLTPETRRMLNASALGRMKPTALLIKVGRGASGAAQWWMSRRWLRRSPRDTSPAPRWTCASRSRCRTIARYGDWPPNTASSSRRTSPGIRHTTKRERPLWRI